MDSIVPFVLRIAAGVLIKLPVGRWVLRRWYSTHPRCAGHKFRSLHPRVLGLLEQEAEGNVREKALETLASELDVLCRLPDGDQARAR